jgi:hypothetical protein
MDPEMFVARCLAVVFGRYAVVEYIASRHPEYVLIKCSGTSIQAYTQEQIDGWVG